MKLQSATEFLTTYAFMFLIIGIIIVVIIYVAFPGQTVEQNQCTAAGGINCNFAIYDSNTYSNTANVIFSISNSGAAPINVIIGNVVIQNRSYPASCTPNLIAPGSGSICNGTVIGSYSPGRQVSGYFSITANYCNSPVSQFGNYVSQENCTYNLVQYVGSFFVYSSLITVQSLSSSSTTSIATVPEVQLTFQSADPSAGQTDIGTATSTITSDKVRIYSCTTVTCASKSGVSGVGNPATYNTASLFPGTYYYEACDLTYHPSICSGVSTVVITAPTYYVPITLKNNGPSATQANFQDLIIVPSSTYSAYINSNWNNVEFSIGGPLSSGGVPIDAWVESGASNGAAQTYVWLSIPSPIPALGSLTVYMNFASGSVLSSSGPTGEAPQLSGSYAQYDDGSLIFPFYDNFAGTALSSKWTAFGNPSYTINDGFSATGPEPSYASIQSSSYTVTPPIIVDFYGAPTYAPSAGWAETGLFGSPLNVGTFVQNGAGDIFGQQQYPASTWSNSGNLATSITTGVWSVLVISSSVSEYQLGYADSQFSSSDAPPYPLNIGLFLSSGGTISPSYTIQWIRVRDYPPGGTMPTATFGSVA